MDLFADELYRRQPQYCGLNAQEYEELAVETAFNKTESFVEQMVNEMQLDGSCSHIFQIAAMQSGEDMRFMGDKAYIVTFELQSSALKRRTIIHRLEHTLQERLTNNERSLLLDDGNEGLVIHNDDLFVPTTIMAELKLSPDHMATVSGGSRYSNGAFYSPAFHGSARFGAAYNSAPFDDEPSSDGGVGSVMKPQQLTLPLRTVAPLPSLSSSALVVLAPGVPDSAKSMVSPMTNATNTTSASSLVATSKPSPKAAYTPGVTRVELDKLGVLLLHVTFGSGM